MGGVRSNRAERSAGDERAGRVRRATHLRLHALELLLHLLELAHRSPRGVHRLRRRREALFEVCGERRGAARERSIDAIVEDRVVEDLAHVGSERVGGDVSASMQRPPDRAEIHRPGHDQVVVSDDRRVNWH